MKKNLRFYFLLLASLGAIGGTQLASLVVVQNTAYGYGYRPGDINRFAEWAGYRIRYYRSGQLNRWASQTGKSWRETLRQSRLSTKRRPTNYDAWGSN